MIVFCDTSALVKLYVAEEGSTIMQSVAATATALAVCRVAWAEAMAALARRARDVPADEAAIDQARTRLRADWPDFLIVEVTQPLVEMAGDLADAFALRGHDSIQLAAARTLHLAGADDVRFAVFDERLKKAALILGMTSAG